MPRAASYPAVDLSEQLSSPNWLRRMRLSLTGGLQRRRMRRAAADVPPLGLKPAGSDGHRPLAPNDLAAIVVARNERRFLPSFLAHYRELGVTRFIVLDDGSTDGSPEYLRNQGDVDVWTSLVRYSEAGRGRYWREGLIAIYGERRWYVIVDADEYLVYDGCDRGVGLADLISGLERRGISRCAAPMIDAYPSGPLIEATFDGTDGLMPWQVATHVDANGYTLKHGKTALELTGGVRRRLFGSGAELMKYPLFRVDDARGIGISVHRPVASVQNFMGIFGALLHFKLFSDTLARADDAVADKQYYRGAREYQKFLDHRAIFETSALFDGSMPIGSSADFVARGFFLPLSEER